MKTPDLKELKAGASHKMPVMAPSLKKPVATRKTVVFFEEQIQHINELGNQLSAQEGRLFNTSEVVRYIVERDKMANS